MFFELFVRAQPVLLGIVVPPFWVKGSYRKSLIVSYTSRLGNQDPLNMQGFSVFIKKMLNGGCSCFFSPNMKHTLHEKNVGISIFARSMPHTGFPFARLDPVGFRCPDTNTPLDFVFRRIGIR